ncbi:MAG TPA: carboxypeptidase-like regulatory domain-containing protein [Pyrinomonadaceae bacterium]|nr:carboxypeptidase-like regulatory domain-containing protein [Pyrinomonadaceae bacterium]
MKRIFLTLAACGFLLLAPAAYACSCATGDPPSEFNDAKAVFVGRMLGGTEKLSVEDRDGKSHTIEAGSVRFVVEEVFKGDLPSVITVEVASMNNTSCGPYGLTRHEQYVVYAYADRQGGEKLHTGVCTRTKAAASSYAKEDLDFLRNLPPPGAGGRLRGRIWADLRAGGATPLADLNVKISGPDGRVVNARTDKEGEFEVEKLAAGRYRVEPELPEHYTTEREFAEVEVADRGTADVAFEAYISGRVRGRVIDKEGQGFDSIFLHLVGEGKKVYGHSTGEDGGFEARGVPPGEYVLYLELRGADYKSNKNFYYPGTFERTAAATIKLELGQTLDGLVFVLPNEFKARTVEGRVVWPDGKPAAGVEVMLLCPQSSRPGGLAVESSPTSTKTDEQGRFRLAGVTGEVYWLEARGTRKAAREGEYSAAHSLAKKIALVGNLKDTELVLSEKGFTGGCGK